MTTVARFMSRPVVTVDGHCSLAEALELMRQHGVRHLVVLDRGGPVGLLSDSDVDRLRVYKPTVDIEVLAVFEAMSAEPYSVTPTDSLATVAGEMARRRLDAVLVKDGPALAGIFTMTDALRALAAVAADPGPDQASAAGSTP